MAESFGNQFMKFMINSPLGVMMGQGMAVITVAGRKTGRLISTPINVVRYDGVYNVLSSRDRTWWRNLRDGAHAKLRVAGKTYNVKGLVLESMDDVRDGLCTFFKQEPMMAKYLKVQVNDDGCLNENDLERVVKERVLIKLDPQK